jgi:putative ABC transport system permease protein
MLRNYLKTAWKVLLRRKFFTFVSLFGISFTLVVLMVATALVDHILAAAPPEVYPDRTLVISRVRFKGPHASWTGGAGFGLLDRYARGIEGVERVTIFSNGRMFYTYAGERKIGLWAKRADAEFWSVLQFDFLEGGPFTEADVAEARFVAVINQASRDSLFGGQPAVGRTVRIDGQDLRIVGVVANVPFLRELPFADVWIPMTISKAPLLRDELMGSLNALILARAPGDIQAIREEFYSRLRRAELPADPSSTHGPRFTSVIAPIETRFELLVRRLLGQYDEEEVQTYWFWVAVSALTFAFMLLPAVNLVNLNVSRIMERSSEIGVRKAFGASSGTLVGQCIAENVVLTALGGVIAVVMATLVLRSITGFGWIPYADLRFNPRIFLLGAGLTFSFGLLSGVYPAWRMSRLHPVDALKGGSR